MLLLCVVVEVGLGLLFAGVSDHENALYFRIVRVWQAAECFSEERKRRVGKLVQKTWCVQLWLRIGTGAVPLFRIWSKGSQGRRVAGQRDGQGS